MTEEEYYRIAVACDRLLRRPDATLEWVAIPWLHVVCQHPVILAKYEHLVDGPRSVSQRDDVSGLFSSASRGADASRYPILALARNVLRAATQNGRRKWIDVEALPSQGADVIIVSWLVNVDHLQKSDDFYFGYLQSSLAQHGLSSLLVLRNQTPHPTRSLLAHAARDGPCGRMLLPDVVEASQELGFVRRCFSARRRLRQAEREVSFWLDRRVAREARRWVVSSPTIANLRLYAQIAGICARLRPSAVLTLHEGHAWERCVWHAARSSVPSVVCVGYQHTILWQHSHAIKRSLRAAGSFDPDAILTVGHVTRQILERSEELQRVRLLTFGTHRRASGAATDGPRSMSTFLVLPEGLEPECIYLFNFALECARRLPDTRFIFRTHSVLSFESVKSKLNGYNPAPSNVEVSRDRPIEDDFARAGCLLYRGSSAVIHAILAGLKPFYVARPGELDIDPLYELSGWRERVFSVEDLVAQYSLHRAPGGNDLEEWKRARAFCDRYMQPVREEAVDKLLELVLKGASGSRPKWSEAVDWKP